MYFHSEIRTFAKPALRLDGSAHKADGLFRYRHAKTRACVFRACVDVFAAERLEYMFEAHKFVAR